MLSTWIRRFGSRVSGVRAALMAEEAVRHGCVRRWRWKEVNARRQATFWRTLRCRARARAEAVRNETTEVGIFGERV